MDNERVHSSMASLGITKGYAAKLNLSDDWALDAIRAVGNYGEIYDRDLGLDSPLKILCGPNNPNVHGGVLYPLPFRLDPN